MVWRDLEQTCAYRQRKGIHLATPVAHPPPIPTVRNKKLRPSYFLLPISTSSASSSFLPFTAE